METHPEVLSDGIIRARHNLREGRKIHGEKAYKVDQLLVTNRFMRSSLIHLFLQSLVGT